MMAAMAGAQLLTNNWYAPRCALRQFGVAAREYAAWLRPVAALAVLALAIALATRVGVTALGGRLGSVGSLAGLAATGILLLPVAWRLARAPEAPLTSAGLLPWAGAARPHGARP